MSTSSTPFSLPSNDHLFPHIQLFPIVGLLLLLMSSSCAILKDQPTSPTPHPKETPKNTYVNPHPIGTYAHFQARQDYPKTYDVWKDNAILKQSNKKNTKITINIAKQRGYFYVNNKIALDFPVSTGVSSFPTKKGSYIIVEKLPHKRSTLYGTYVNSSGKTIKYNADTSKDPLPEGASFKGADMPYWMRLTWSGLGMHIGNVKRYPVSHGCIRTPREVCPIIYANVQEGTPVHIK